MRTRRARYLLYVYFLDFNRMVGHRDFTGMWLLRARKLLRDLDVRMIRRLGSDLG